MPSLPFQPVLLWSDSLIWMLVLTTLWLVWRGRRDPFTVQSLQRLAQDKAARWAMAALLPFVLVGLLDSLHYRPALTPTESAKAEQKVSYRVEVLSLLDAIATPLRTQNEKTYSAPLATHSFAKEMLSHAEGQQVRDFPALKYPGSHLFGTDKVGQDVLYQVLKSIRTALVIGLVTTLVTLPLGIFFGILAGYFRGWVDDVVQYIYTVISSVPSVLLIAASVLMMQVIIDAHPQWFATAAERADLRLLALCAIMGMTSWTGLARLLRGETLKLRELDYIQAAHAFAVPHWRILARHILPNLLPIVLIALVMDFSSLVLSEAVLSYVGIGVDPATISFGTMINNARLELGREPVVWWTLTAAFIFMFILVLAANVLADAVQNAFDPRGTR